MNLKLVTTLAGVILAGTLVYQWYQTQVFRQTIQTPSEPESAQIAISTTIEFAKAVNAKDLSLFRNNTAIDFKRQYSREHFLNAFGGYIEQHIDLLPVANYKPVFSTTPYITEQGILILQGMFPTRPSQVKFDYSYTWQDGNWKLIGITLDVNPVKA